jgi:ribosomal protein S12 methylthiotransferase
VKISEGCDASCAFCTIPSIKGRQVSRPIEELADETADLTDRGIREIVLIGQDTTSYGRDLGIADGLATLLERLCDAVPEQTWIRFMYAFPTRLSDRLLDVVASRSRMVKYLDLPLQHSHPAVLGRMRRPAHGALALIERARARVPGLAIRGTFIVGFPGETDAEFAHLLDFLRAAQLDRVGVFEYSPEPGTPAATLPDLVPSAVVVHRMARLAEVQQTISRRRLAALVGTEMSVLLEGAAEQSRSARGCRTVGRSERDAPEVDGLVYVREDLPAPAFVKVRIESSSDHDLFGRLATPAPTPR